MQGTIGMKRPIPGLRHPLSAMLLHSNDNQPATEPDPRIQNCRVAGPSDTALADTLVGTAAEAVVASGLVHAAFALIARSAAPAVSSAFRFAVRLARKGPRF